MSKVGKSTQISLVAQTVKNLPTMQETHVRSLGQKIPWRREWLPGEFHARGVCMGYMRTEKPGGLQSKESYTTEQLMLFHFFIEAENRLVVSKGWE